MRYIILLAVMAVFFSLDSMGQSQDIEALKKLNQDFLHSIDSVEVRLLTADVGIVSAWTTFVMKVEGKSSTGKNCYQDVYMKRGNKWVAVSAHVTMLGNR